jgi:predicted metal-dependent hydrolase
LAIGFEGKQVDLSFYMNNQFATIFFATLSVFLTYGEDLVIETARHHRDLLKDPILRQRVTSLIGQRRFTQNFIMSLTMQLLSLAIQ